MAKKAKKVKETKSSYFSVNLEKKKKLLGFFLTVFALLSFLSILSYSRSDNNLLLGISDIFEVFSSDPDYLRRAESIHNWLGMFGAHLSYFFVNSTIGYFSIVFPIIMFIWGNEIYNWIAYP